MEDDTTGHAMTEIALALAMAFFCLLVLALVSMGGPSSAERAVAILDLTTSAPSDRQAPLEDTDVFLILDGDRFLDRNAQPIDPASIQVGAVKGAMRGAGRLVLALSPDSAISSVMRARERLAGHEVVLTTLDADWRRRLADRTDAIRSPAQENVQ